MSRPAVFLALLLILNACVPLPVESALDACPLEGLAAVSFTDGRPPGGTVIPAESGENGVPTWSFSGHKDIYLTCRYDDGAERLQRLPNQMKSCSRAPGGNIMCMSYI